ncbi:YdjY domain-containing protein [Hugonella massiliensis]|uniref:YdjY domain-containing protein n=1 Tax=Hugonella massiliensis TaxID=1720315 RepID=UPI00232A50C8|nr:YdjY domain-containing protein [Hugonella massiliensis]
MDSQTLSAFGTDMSRRRFLAGLGVAGLTVALAPLTACSSGSGSSAASSSSAQESAGASADPTEGNPIVVDAAAGEVRYLAEVNAVYFTQGTRHGVVYQGGSNGEKAILRGLGDEKEFYQALVDAGFTPGNNLTAEDMKAPAGQGKSVEGDKLDVTLKWDGQDEMPFVKAVSCTAGDYTPDFRFGGNLESAKKNNTGCVLCLDSCATGIVSDAHWPTGTTQTGTAMFTGREDVLPADGTRVVVTFRRA